ncbi:glycosyltransferase family 4 protein [Desulfococcus sp.]|uniref:glycosyltransferase family 4 protein n=1 Tax=Desulfococcus sp. TaxID=2025834 RepID=UPI003593E45A
MALIAVDVTPMMPGGENGGVKILTLELLRAFQREAGDHRFLLLTASWNHDELAGLEAPTMTRLLILDKSPSRSAFLDRFHGRTGRVLRKLAAIVRRKVPRGTFARRRSLTSRGVDLLFCPFTAPTHIEPGIPTVSVIHDMQHKDYPQFFPEKEIETRNLFMADVRAKAGRIVCISENVRDSVLRHLNADPEKTHVVYNCIQSRLGADIPPETRQAVLQRLGIHQRPYMFYPANFWPHKNHRMLLTAYGMFRHRHPDLAPDLAFTGALVDEERLLKQAAAGMGIREHVHFLGFLPQEELDVVWQGSRFLIFPSLYEGFGIPVVEAMSLGKPVLCSNVTSLPEVAGDAALFFDPRKPGEMVAAMARITGDPSLAADLAGRGRLRAQQYRSERMIRGYLEVFREALGCPAGLADGVAGMFEDGWTAEEVSITYGPGPDGRRLEILLEAPVELPGGRRLVSVIENGKRVRRERLARGEERVLSLPLPARRGEVSLIVSPVFQPALCGMGPDNRRLGVICRGCSVVSPDGESVSLLKHS